MDIIPGKIDLSSAEIELASETDREYRLHGVLEKKKLERYDYVIIDTTPSLGLLTINALTASDSVIIPIQAEYYALEGVSNLMRIIYMIKGMLNPDPKIKGVLLTMYDKRTKISQEVQKDVINFFEKQNMHVFKKAVPRNVKLAEAPSYGMPISIYDSDCAGDIVYRELAEEVRRLKK